MSCTLGTLVINRRHRSDKRIRYELVFVALLWHFTPSCWHLTPTEDELAAFFVFSGIPVIFSVQLSLTKRLGTGTLTRLLARYKLLCNETLPALTVSKHTAYSHEGHKISWVKEGLIRTGSGPYSLALLNCGSCWKLAQIYIYQGRLWPNG